MKKLFAIILCTLCFHFSQAQQAGNSKSDAMRREAIDLMDAGKLDEAIDKLQQAIAIDPNNYTNQYELGLAYYMKKDIRKALEIYKKLVKHPNADDQTWQMLGNAYDDNGESQKALDTYLEGNKRFPNSGKLYLETGNVFFMKKQYDDALSYYESGISVDPMYPSNYFRAAILFFNTDNELWGMMYGELFMNLEKNTQRTAQMSEMLYSIYRSEIKMTSDTSMSISFANSNITITLDDLENMKKSGDLKMPYGLMVYEPLVSAAVPIDSVNLENLCKMRSNFLDLYFKQGHNKTYPHVLFDYQMKVKQAGHLNAYNHWVLKAGDTKAFEKWKNGHKTEWDAFTRWFSENKLEITARNKFVRKTFDK